MDVALGVSGLPPPTKMTTVKTNPNNNEMTANDLNAIGIILSERPMILPPKSSLLFPLRTEPSLNL